MRRLWVVLAACGGGHAAAPSAQAPAAAHEAPAAPGPAVEWATLVGPIRAVEVKAADATAAARAKELLASEIGQAIDRDRTRDVLAKVFALHGVADVTARGVQRSDGVTLVIELAALPSVHALAAHESGKDLPLPGQFAAATGLPLDAELVDALAAQLRDGYLERGFLDVAVDWQARPAGGSQVDVAIEVTPGKAVIVDKIELKGNAHAKTGELVKAIAGEVVAGQPWRADHFERAVLLLDAYYYDHGFVNVAIDPPTPAGEHTSAVFTVREGDQFKIGKLSVKGVPDADGKKYLAMLGTKAGQVFSRTTMVTGIQKITDASHGNVTPLTDIDMKKKTIDITLDIAVDQKSVSPTSK